MYLHSSFIETPLGKMIAIADYQGLFVLAFTDQKNIAFKIEKLKRKTSAEVIFQTNPIIDLITAELKAYFGGTLQNFTTPYHLIGSSFQKDVWQALANIPYGKKYTYAQQAASIGNKKAYRAVGSANGNNILAIILACHRVVARNGKLAGYAGGLDRKQWLIEHEERFAPL